MKQGVENGKCESAEIFKAEFLNGQGISNPNFCNGCFSQGRCEVFNTVMQELLNGVGTENFEDDFCQNCQYWKETSSGKGICNNPNKPEYNTEVNAMDSCGNH